MKRIVVLGQAGRFGDAWSQYAAARLARRLDVPCLATSEGAPGAERTPGWVATLTVGALSGALLRAADTAIWLHFLPLAVARQWVLGLRSELTGSLHGQQCPRLSDLPGSLMHMAWTPHVHRLLRHPGLAQHQIFHLRSPDETDFWLRAQEHRLPSHQAALAQPA